MGIVKVASTKELASGQMKKVEAESKIILLVNLQGEYYAIGNRCTHMGCMLSNGTLKGENVQCSCHGSTFNVRTECMVVQSVQPEIILVMSESVSVTWSFE